jgi:hypothetical protein
MANNYFPFAKINHQIATIKKVIDYSMTFLKTTKFCFYFPVNPTSGLLSFPHQ